MNVKHRLVCTAILLTVVLTVAHAFAGGRVVAVGDIHGSYEGWTAILREAGLIDEKNQWTGGTDTYIQLGDMFDRGLHVRDVIDLMMEIQDQAAAAGGAVKVILGNHETMNLTGFYRDVHPEIFNTFVDAKSGKRQKKLWSKIKDFRTLTGEPVDDAAREIWMAEHPPGWAEYAEALGPRGIYGKWLRSLPVARMIDGMLFIHGGIGPSMAGVSVEEINTTAKMELATFDRARQFLVAKSILAPTAGTVEVSYGVHMILVRAEQPDSTDQIRAYAQQVKDLAGIDDWYLMAPDGPLWFRGAARWDETERGDEMAALLDGIGADVMVVGHTPDREGTIRVRFGNRVFLIDTGMLSSYYRGGRPSALEIEDGVFTAIYFDHREVLVDTNALDKAAVVLPGIRELPIARR